MDKQIENPELNTSPAPDSLFELLDLEESSAGTVPVPGTSGAGAAMPDAPDDDAEYDDGVYDDDDAEYDDDDDDAEYDDDDDDADYDDDPGSTADDDIDELPIINGRRVERRKKPRVKKDPEFDLTHPDYTLTLTKGLTNEVVRRRYYPHNRAIATFVLSFLVFVLAVCFIVYSVIYMIGNERLKRAQASQIDQLTREVRTLMDKNGELSSTVTHLSRSVNRTLEDYRVEAQAFEQGLIPQGFPLSTFVPMEIVTEDEGDDAKTAVIRAEDADAADTENADAADTEDADAADSSDTGTTETEDADAAGGGESLQIETAVFEAEKDAFVVAAGGGVVTRITSDGHGGLILLIDHRNGYVTSYHNGGEALVNVGDSVFRGDELFRIGENNTLLRFRVRVNDTYLNPQDVIEIGG